LKTGKYYLGDPCFALNEHYHYDIWQDMYKCDNGKNRLNRKKKRIFMIVHHTHYGDGIYYDSKKKKI